MNVHHIETTSPRFVTRKETLARHVHDLASRATHCDCCRRTMTRTVTLRDGVVVTKKDRMGLDTSMTDDEWELERLHWECVCRMCGQVFEASATQSLQLLAFWRWLKAHETMTNGTAKEYWVRMRRVDALVTVNGVSPLDYYGMVGIIDREYHEEYARPYLVALNKYFEFCGRVVANKRNRKTA